MFTFLAKKIGGDEGLPTPNEQLGALKNDLKARIKDLKRIGVLAGVFFSALIILAFFLR